MWGCAASLSPCTQPPPSSRTPFIQPSHYAASRASLFLQVSIYVAPCCFCFFSGSVGFFSCFRLGGFLLIRAERDPCANATCQKAAKNVRFYDAVPRSMPTNADDCQRAPQLPSNYRHFTVHTTHLCVVAVLQRFLSPVPLSTMTSPARGDLALQLNWSPSGLCSCFLDTDLFLLRSCFCLSGDTLRGSKEDTAQCQRFIVLRVCLPFISCLAQLTVGQSKRLF